MFGMFRLRKPIEIICPILILSFLIAAFALMFLPDGIKLIFVNAEGTKTAYYYSYFDPIVFGYGRILPFIIGIYTCVLLVFAIIRCFLPWALRKTMFALSIIGLAFVAVDFFFSIYNLTIVDCVIMALYLLGFLDLLLETIIKSK